MISREEYLKAFSQGRDEVARSRCTIEGSYKAIEKIHPVNPQSRIAWSMPHCFFSPDGRAGLIDILSSSWSDTSR